MKFWAILIAILMTGNSWSDEINYNQVSLMVDAKQQVENDLLVAIMYTQHDGGDPAKLANQVNKEMGWALDVARKQSNIEHQTLSYTSNPIYKKSQVTGWRVRQTLQLKSKDHTALSQLIGQLQSRLAVQSITYRISDDRRKKAEDQLIAEALTNFQARAQLVTAQLARSTYRLVNLNINSNVIAPRPYARNMAMQMDAAPPQLEAGTQEVRISVQGTIELSLK